MRHLDLFSGIGGFALAARWAGWETVGFCEIDQWCQRVLAKHWPDVPICDDIKELNGESIGLVDIISGGYPCQPFSHAGKRRGEEDDRHLWPEFARIIREVRPRWVVGENVAGHINMGLDQVLADLEGEGYTWEAFVIPACAVNAAHRRDRVWVVAHSDSHGKSNGTVDAGQIQGKLAATLADDRGERGKRLQRELAEPGECRQRRETDEANCVNDASDALRERQPGPGRPGQCGNTEKGRDRQEHRAKYALQWPAEPPVRRTIHGVSRGMDRNRLTGLGNAIVPQVAYQIFEAINESVL